MPHIANVAAFMLLLLPHIADSAAFLLLLLPHIADSAAFLLLLLLHIADSAAFFDACCFICPFSKVPSALLPFISLAFPFLVFCHSF